LKEGRDLAKTVISEPEEESLASKIEGKKKLRIKAATKALGGSWFQIRSNKKGREGERKSSLSLKGRSRVAKARAGGKALSTQGWGEVNPIWGQDAAIQVPERRGLFAIKNY